MAKNNENQSEPSAAMPATADRIEVIVMSTTECRRGR
jgi:hypothetical protein